MLTIILLVILGVLLTFFLIGIRIVRPMERGLVETFGKYSRFAMPGFHWIFPGVQTMIVIDIAEDMVESGEKQMITNDNLNATIDSQVYYKVKPDEESCKAAEYNVVNYDEQIVSLTKTTLRNIIGTMTLKTANSERGKINEELKKLLEKETANWGIEIVRAEIKEIDPPRDVQDAMNMVVKAENEKIAAIDFATAAETQADGKKRSAIKEAEGLKQAQILAAQATAEATETIAKGRANAIQLESEAANKYFVGNAQLLRKLEAVEKSLKDNTKILIPEGQQLINLIGNLTKD